MKTAIVTLPLHTNYGGLLQAYALKTALESMGHEVTVLDLKDKMPSPKGLKAPFIYANRALKKLLKGSSGPEVFREKRYKKELPILSAETSVFVDSYIKPRLIDSYEDVKEGEYEAFVVGSDQVWRPRYFNPVENAFLAFTKGWDVKRIAYAASFGTDQLEYEPEQLNMCSKLLAEFDGVSVREDSAVGLCEEWLDREDAVHALDPVMLLDPQAYVALASSAKTHPADEKIVTYILDASPEKTHVVEFMKKITGHDVYDASVYPYVNDRPVHERVVPGLENWLAAFADAEFVVTDSFHGCVLSLLLHKRFIAVGNSRRGMARLSSLLNMFGLDKYFDGVCISSDEECSKPDAHYYQTLFDRYGLKKEESIMIGNDYISDIGGAADFGIDSLYIHQSISPEIKGELRSQYTVMDGDVYKIKKLIVKE